VFTATTTYKAFSQNRLGRFLSPDPYGQFYSAYTGMGNNPVNLVDPSGGWVDGDIAAIEIVDEMPWGLKDAANVTSMFITLKKMEVALTYMDAVPEAISFWANAGSWIIRNMSPYPIGGSQPSNSGEGGPDDGSTSVASSSSSRPTNNSGATNNYSSPSYARRNGTPNESVPDAYGTNSEGNPPRDIEKIARELASDPTNLDLIWEYVEAGGKVDNSDPKKIASVFSEYNAGYIVDEKTSELFPSLDYDVNKETNKYLIESGGVVVLGMVNSGVGTVLGLGVVAIEGSEIMLKNMNAKYQATGDRKGLFVVNVKSPGAVPKAAIFNASNGGFLGWYYTTISGAPMLEYYQYQKMLKQL
jgi:hypothetical protein